jgi:hypothetical protein
LSLKDDIVSKSSTLTAISMRERDICMGKYAILNQKDGCLRTALLFLGQIKREKGVWWMPWQQEAMKDVIPCVKPWGAGNRL